ETPASSIAGDDLGGQVRVLARPIGRSGHQPEQHEVEQDDREHRHERLHELAADVAPAHCACMVSVVVEGRRSGPRQTLVPGSLLPGYSSSTARVARRRYSHQPPTTTITTTTSRISKVGLTPEPDVPPVLGPCVAG